MRIFTVVAALLLLAACETNPDGTFNKANVGTVLGAVGGGLLGSQIGGGNGKLIAVGVGTLGGAFLGRTIGQSLDNADRAAMNRAQTQAFNAPIGQSISWSNPQNGNRGAITPRRDGQDAAGNYCREFTNEIAIGGKPETAYGTACRQPDGTWKVVN